MHSKKFSLSLSTSRRILKNEYEIISKEIDIEEYAIGRGEEIVKRIFENKKTYEKVADMCSFFIPWWITGILHYHLQNFEFDKHIHNNIDPLVERTKHTPKNKPKKGEPPFSWQESASDFLEGLKRFLPSNDNKWGDIFECLYFIEASNKFKERMILKRHPLILWNGTNICNFEKEKIGSFVLLTIIACNGEGNVCLPSPKK